MRAVVPRPGRVAGMLLLVATCLLSGRPAAAQDAPPVSRVQSLWAEEGSGGLAELMAESVRLHLGRDEHVGVSPRQVQASLDRLFQRFGPAPLVPVREGVLRDDADRAFAEFHWVPSSAAGEAGRTQVVYVGFRRDGGRWRIVELRVLG